MTASSSSNGGSRKRVANKYRRTARVIDHLSGESRLHLVIKDSTSSGGSKKIVRP
jgi:hypothetical protein